ncbi:putative gustatory receptor 39b [Bactrocera neohumeralis]|uniref:putative gustatory receptor 39b n=1 Tax=Bactrocera neohumeralis TaxID=98809 RepID=UPI0021669476|nr:putative gustatory receptor 39b [Bactrocera neohumeralis]
MERQLRGWLRYCTYFGIYVGAFEDSSLRVTIHNVNSTSSHFAIETRRRAQWCRRAAICSTLTRQRLYLCLLMLVLGVVYTHGLITRATMPGISWVAATLLYSLHVMAVLFILLEAWHKQAQHDRFLQLLEQIEVTLRLRLQHKVQHAVLFNGLRRLIAYLLVFSMLGFALFALSTMWLPYVDYFWHGIWLIIIIRIRLIQLIVYLCILRHFLQCLCTRLRSIVAARLSLRCQILDVDCERLCLLQRLLAVKEIYELLHKEFQLLNDFAGWSLFASISSYLLDAICTLYWMLLSIEGFVRRRHYEIAGLFMLLPLAAILWYLMYLCDNCQQLARSVSQLLSKLMIINSANRALRPQRLLLYQFSAQLQIQRIEVSAHSFFILEMRFLIAICTVVVTNLVILVQILKS